MTGDLELFWIALTAPLSWMPPFCLKVLESVGAAIVVIVVILVSVKVISAAKGDS